MLGLDWDTAAAAARGLVTASGAVAPAIATVAAAAGLRGVAKTAEDATARIAKGALECLMSIGRAKVRGPITLDSAAAAGVCAVADGLVLSLPF